MYIVLFSVDGFVVYRHQKAKAIIWIAAMYFDEVCIIPNVHVIYF